MSYKMKVPSAGLLLTLLAAVAAVMFMLSKCSRPVTTPPEFVKPGGDTLCVAIEISPVTTGADDDDAKVHGTNYVGTDIDSFSANDSYYGMMMDMSRREKRPMVIVPVTFDEGVKGLEEHIYDILIADIPATVVQKKRFLLTDPVDVDRQVLVQMRGGEDGDTLMYGSPFDLLDDTVYVAHSSPFVARIGNLANEMGGTIHVVEDDNYGQEQLIMMVMSGERPNAVVNERQAAAFAADNTALDYSVVISLNQPLSWAVADGDTVTLNVINKYIRDYKKAYGR